MKIRHTKKGIEGKIDMSEIYAFKRADTFLNVVFWAIVPFLIVALYVLIVKNIK